MRKVDRFDGMEIIERPTTIATLLVGHPESMVLSEYGFGRDGKRLLACSLCLHF